MSRTAYRRDTSDPLGRAFQVISDRIKAHPDFDARLAEAKANAVATCADFIAADDLTVTENLRRIGGLTKIATEAIEATEPINDGSALWGTISSHTVLRSVYYVDQVRHAVHLARREALTEAAR